jgi:DNA-binding beta-propeller fold protein YncE
VHDLAAGTNSRTFLPGEAKTMTPIGDRLYLGVYTLARLWSMRPDGTELAELDRIENEQTRPTDAWYDADSGRLLIATEADYGKINGALADYRLSDETLTVRRGIVPNQSLKSVAVKDGIAFLGSETRNSLGTDPIEKEATVSRFDLRTGRVLGQFAPVPGAQQITDLMPYRGRIYGTTEKGDLFVLDPSGRRVVATAKIGTGASTLVLARGGLYGTDGKRLFKITDGTTPVITTVVDGLNAQAYAVGLIAVAPDGRTIYTIKGRNLIAVTRF